MFQTYGSHIHAPLSANANARGLSLRVHAIWQQATAARASTSKKASESAHPLQLQCATAAAAAARAPSGCARARMPTRGHTDRRQAPRAPHLHALRPRRACLPDALPCAVRAHARTTRTCLSLPQSHEASWGRRRSAQTTSSSSPSPPHPTYTSGRARRVVAADA